MKSLSLRLPFKSLKSAQVETNTSKKSLSLRNVLIVPFVVQILLAGGLIGYFSYRNSQEGINEVSSQLRQELNARIQSELKTYLEIPQVINQLNASAVEFGTLNLDSTETMMTHFWQQLLAYELISLIYVGRNTGQFFGASRDSGVVAIDYTDPVETNGVYLSYIADDRGQRGPLRPNLELVPYDPRLRPWYIATEEVRQPTWSPLYTFIDPPSLGLTATVPLFGDNDEIEAVFATDLTLQIITDFLRQIELVDGGSIFVVERETGVLLGNSSNALPFGNLLMVTWK
ncbi:MAG: hypothetical protein HC924_18180 [Synechococcaceae cyanobacterium SM2_3_2]|nr:hypothetical protein [Synechococcaceae cyanobacterium SM2_3_2]